LSQEFTVPFHSTPFDLGQFGAWVVIAIAAIAILVVVLKIVSKIISTSLRVAILVGALLVIAAALWVLGMLLRGGVTLPIP
jgi:hypothetical protein